MTCRRVKLVVFVPDTHLDIVTSVIKEHCGRIGNYTGCMFLTPGIAKFTPVDGANPTIGSIDREESVPETRIETTCYECELSTIISSIREVHPYEEPGIESYNLRE